MRLYIRHDLFVTAAIRESMVEPMHRPITVRHLVCKLEPIVRFSHCHAIVEPHAAMLERRSASRHSRDILGHRDCRRIDLVDHSVRKRYVRKGIHINIAIEVHRIVGECNTKTMVMVHHGRNAVETVSVETVFIQPEAAVGKKEMQHFRLAVVETARIPCGVPPPRTGMEIQAVLSVKKRKTIAFVLDGMGMDKVHYDTQSHPMRSVDKRLQILWRSETR